MGEFSLSQAAWVAAAFTLGVACTLIFSSETTNSYVNARPERRYVMFAGGGRAVDTAPEPRAASVATPSLGSQTNPRPKYGFYLHVYQPTAAVVYQVKQIKRFFAGAPIYIMSDGGARFDGLCAKEGCTFKLCPPSNDRWHPWPFFKRFHDAALALDAEYIIMLEPDNTIHREFKIGPTHDAGGLRDENPHFSNATVTRAEGIGRKVRPGFKWEYTGSGLAGGSYFKREAALDAFSDKVISSIDWNFYMKNEGKRIFSSDFAMPVLLAERGWTYAPWLEIRQVEPTEDRMVHQPKEAAIQHYGRGVAGGKPTYNMEIVSWQEDALVAPPLEMHKFWNSNCQLCYNLSKYIEVWGSSDCTNPTPYKYAPGVMKDVMWEKAPPSRPFYPIRK